MVRARSAEQHVRLVGLVDGVTRDWLEVADVMSEGRVEDGPLGRTYFGSTSVLLRASERGEIDAATLVCLVESDPHIRTRVIRLARREAAIRAPSAFGTMSVDLAFRASNDGVVITVDVAATIATSGRALGK